MAIKEFLINGKTVAVEILEQHPAYFKFKISVNTVQSDKTFEISLEKYDPSHQILDLVINNQPVKIKYTSMQAPEISLNQDNLLQASLFYIITHSEQVLVQHAHKKLQDSRVAGSKIEPPRFEEPKGLDSGSKFSLKSPLTGRIIKVLVKPGDQVAKNQPLVIIESMKMENEIRATLNGFIKSISISEGNLVQQNQVLIIFE